MKVGVLGTGVVGQTLASRLVGLGHEVIDGSPPGRQREGHGLGRGRRPGARRPAPSPTPPAFGDLIVNATAGTASLDALAAAGAENLAGKVVVDVANPLDFSGGMPPTLSVCNTDSLGEQIQRPFPDARVVKALNTVNADVMVHPEIVPGAHTMFLCGNDAAGQAGGAGPPRELRLARRRPPRPGRHRRRPGHGDVPAPLAAPVGRHRHRPPQREGERRGSSRPAPAGLVLQEAGVGGDVDGVLPEGVEGHDVEGPLVGARPAPRTTPPRRGGPAASWRRSRTSGRPAGARGSGTRAGACRGRCRSGAGARGTRR